jgi:hypothetical protein
MEKPQAYNPEDYRKAVMDTNSQIAERVKESNGVVDAELTKLLQRRLMQGLWLQTI